MAQRAFDAVLVIAFGGPQGPDDIRPFLENVLRGRRVPASRVDEVARHYELFGGVSPLTELTRRQAAGLEAGLAAAGLPLPVHVGMRNWHPYLAETMAAMSRAGVRRAIGFIAAAYSSYSSTDQYHENVAEARAALAREGLADIEIEYVPEWYAHPEFIAANAERALAAIATLPADLQHQARLVFTAHSIPMSMAERYPYRRQFEDTAELVAEMVRVWMRPGAAAEVRLKRDATTDGPANTGATAQPDYATVYQSRSGRPDDPWLEPDVAEYLRAEHARGLKAAVLCPIGFVSDHIEVLYDLDVEAAEVCREIGLPMVRAQTVNDHPRFIKMMTDVVAGTAVASRVTPWTP